MSRGGCHRSLSALGKYEELVDLGSWFQMGSGACTPHEEVRMRGQGHVCFRMGDEDGPLSALVVLSFHPGQLNYLH